MTTTGVIGGMKSKKRNTFHGLSTALGLESKEFRITRAFIEKIKEGKKKKKKRMEHMER